MIDADPGDIAVFLEEATELFADFEQCLLLLETLPDDIEVLNRAFRDAHTIKGGAGMLGLDPLATFTHELEHLLDDLRDKQLLCNKAVIETLLAAADVIKAHLDNLGLGKSEEVPGQVFALSAIWKVRAEGDVPEPATPVLAQPVAAPVRPPAPAVAAPVAVPVAVAGAGTASSSEPGSASAPASASPPKEAEHKAEASASIRVSIDKVDQLVNLVGELSITQAMIGQLAAHYSPAKVVALQEAVAQMERHCRDLQQRVLGIRMVPVKGVFDRFHRVVRDMAAQTGKQVHLDIKGEETELDKTVVERVADPLTHLVRNAVDHGLEGPDERAAKSKPAKGTLGLAAYQKGGNIFIEVRDDGRGLDRARILAKARKQGLVAEGRELSDDEVYSLIFLPGFSTAEKVTELSGRGVGMDVVRRNIEELKGKVGISTVLGQGTTFRIQLPLTLAMLDGLVTRVGAQEFLLPLVSVVGSFRPTPRQLGRVDALEVVEVRGAYLPLVRLHKVFDVPTKVTDPTKGIVVIIDDGNKTCGLFVDALVGQLQVVVKSLESNYRRVPGIAGATILGGGQVALILDASGLASLARTEDGRFAAPAAPLPPETRS